MRRWRADVRRLIRAMVGQLGSHAGASNFGSGLRSKGRGIA